MVNRTAASAVGTFLVAIVSVAGFRFLPPTYSTVVWKTAWIPLCLLGLYLAHRMMPSAALGELGLRGNAARGLAIAFLASLPMLAVLGVTGKFGTNLSPAKLVQATAFAALTEEILFRGYLFRQLYRRAGWGFFSAVAMTAFLFGIAHASHVLVGFSLWQIVAEIGITGIGGAFFAWLLVRWNDNLWVPIGMHAFMNLWWELYEVDSTAIGNRTARAARFLAVAAAIVITLWRTPRLSPRASRERK